MCEIFSFFKSQVVAKLKILNCDKTQKFKLRHIVTKLEYSNCDKTQFFKRLKYSKFDKTQIMTNLKLWPNSKTQNVTNLKKGKLWQNSIYDKTQLMTKLQTSLLVRTTWHLENRWDDLWAAFCDSCYFFVVIGVFWNSKNLGFIYIKLKSFVTRILKCFS